MARFCRSAIIGVNFSCNFEDMEHIKGTSREQLRLFAESIEDYVSEDNPVRVIEAFIESLNLVELRFDKAEVSDRGRPPYDPKALLKLYVWGYMNRVNSSRRLERETHRNLEVKWLIRGLTPDDKTISEFRKDNREAIKGVFVEFRVVCQNLKLFGENEVAIDGSKFKASNSKKRNKKLSKLKRRISEIEKEVDLYLSTLEKNDLKEVKLPKADAKQLAQKINELQTRMSEYKELVEELEHQGKTQVSQTDPDSRSMTGGGSGGSIVGYNVQSSVDSKYSLIVDYEVTNEPNDMNQLAKQAKAAHKALGSKELDVLVDAGYHNGREIQECEQESGITVYAPSKAPSVNTSKGVPTREYYPDKFAYDPKKDEYRCPKGERLELVKQGMMKGKKVRIYQASACANCEARKFCTTSKQGRTISRSEYQEAVDAVATRSIEKPEKVARRGIVVEHPFGTIKNRGQGSFLMRGIGKVTAEFGLSALAYNITRAINIVSVPVMVAACYDTS